MPLDLIDTDKLDQLATEAAEMIRTSPRPRYAEWRFVKALREKLAEHGGDDDDNRHADSRDDDNRAPRLARG